MADASDLMRAAMDQVADLASKLDMLQRAIGAGDPHAELALRTQDARASLAALDLSVIDALLAQARREGIEAAAARIEPSYPRPCDCTSCSCWNIGDAEAVAAWDSAKAAAADIRALIDQPAKWEDET